jgi:hypothetical protein
MVDQAHFNPVKHGLVGRGYCPADWARGDDDFGGFGEVEGEPE